MKRGEKNYYLFGVGFSYGGWQNVMENDIFYMKINT